MKKLLLTLSILLSCSTVWGETYYVRVDGGTASQCTGLADDAYPGSGTGQACAHKHPYYTLGWYADESSGNPTGGTAGVISGGDTLIIKQGTYKFGAPWPGCYTSGSGVRLCVPRLIPSGTEGNPTRIFGCSSTGCGSGTVPKITATGRLKWTLNIRDRNYIDFHSLELTDSAACSTLHPTLSCGSQASLDDGQGADGMYVARSNNINMTNMNIHGFYRYGLWGGKISNWILTDTRINYNGMNGWEMDNQFSLDSSNSGYIKFIGTSPVVSNNALNKCSLSWNGCVEDPNNPGTVVSQGCHKGNADGIGTINSSGEFSFTQCDISFNGHDGLDFLYLNKGGKTGGSLTVKRCRMEGNRGNPVKGPNTTHLEDNLIIGNCRFFTGQPFSTTEISNEPCRAFGHTIGFGFRNNSTVPPKVYNNTIIGGGRGIFLLSGTDTDACQTGVDIDVRNNIILGGWAGDDTTKKIYLWYNANVEATNVCKPELLMQDNICIAKDGWHLGIDCTHTISVSNDPGRYQTSVSGNVSITESADVFTGTILQGPSTFYTNTNYMDQLFIKSGSNPRNRADKTIAGTDDKDFNNFDRDAADNLWDLGGLEYGTINDPGDPPEEPPGPACGNDTTESEGNEVCDGSDLNGFDCTDYTEGSIFDGGTLACKTDCSDYDTSSCTIADCGNGSIDSGEECDTDGPLLNGQTCASLGFSAQNNNLACTESTCLFNTSGCVAVACQDGYKDTNEQCDDGNATQGDGCSSLCETEISGYELFLNYTDTDPNSRTSVRTHRNNIAGLTRTESANLKRDLGAGAIGDFNYKYYFKQLSAQDGGSATITYDAGSEKYESSVSSNTFAHTVADQSNRLLVCAITREEWETNRTISSVTYDGTAMTLGTGTTTSNGSNRVHYYYQLAPTVGTANVVVTYSGVVGSTAVACDSFYNVAQQAPQVTSTSVDSTNNFVTQTDNSLAVGSVVAAISTATFTMNGTELHNFANPGEHAIGVSYAIVSQSGASSLSYGVSTGSYATAALIFAPANTGGDNPAMVGIISAASDSYSNIKAQKDAGDGFYLIVEAKSSTESTVFRLVSVDDGTEEDTFTVGNISPEYWGTLTRSGTTLTNTLYSDKLRTATVDTQTVTTTETTHQYLMAGASYNDSTSGTSVSAVIGDFELTSIDGGGGGVGESTYKSIIINGQTVTGGSWP